MDIEALRVRTENSNVLLDLKFDRSFIPELFQTQGEILVQKSEFHVTLIGREHRLRDYMEEEYACSGNVLETYIRMFVANASQNIAFKVKPLPEIYFVEKEYREPMIHLRKSIIVCCEVLGIKDFYANFEAHTGFKAFSPPFHITLYTLGDEMSRQGIGVYSANDVQKFCRLLDDESSRELYEALVRV